MIPFASQRGYGQDLATHLQKEVDNEYVEVADIRGAAADDLHGAFAEWEAQAHALTNCRNYLYSLSINPDQATYGPLSRAQYDDYIGRVEQTLALAEQPRAVVFHIKNEREHCHVVWSRIDVEQEKAVHLAYDRDKLMMVTRQFARDHSLRLPAGYERKDGLDQRKSRQLSLYEKHQEDTVGLTKEQRMAQVTEAWQRSDSPLAFVQALGDCGYILATGKRPYLLVDLYGHVNALPKLIDDRLVRTKDVRARLEQDFPPESLPPVDEAREMAEAHRRERDEFRNSQHRADQLDLLKNRQAERRRTLEQEIDARKVKLKDERLGLDAAQLADRRSMKSTYLEEVRAVRAQREATKPTGLAAFLGRVTGVALITSKLQRHQDKRRYDAFRDQKNELMLEQETQRQQQQRAHEMQALELERKRSALDKIEHGEMKNFQTTLEKERSIAARAGHDHMPALNLELRPGGRRAVMFKAARRHTGELAQELGRARRGKIPTGPTHLERLQETFARAGAPDNPSSSAQTQTGSAGTPPQPQQPQVTDPPKPPPEPSERSAQPPQDFTRQDGPRDSGRQR